MIRSAALQRLFAAVLLSLSSGSWSWAQSSAPDPIVGQLAVGSNFTCAVTTTGGAVCWGNNNSGQLGDGTNAFRGTPGNVAGLTGGVARISAGAFHACALTTGGGVKCWGNNDTAQLGDGTTTQRNAPVDVVGLTSGVAGLSTGSSHSCAVTTAGGVKCWGHNSNGQIGDDLPLTPRLVPANVLGLTSGVLSVAAGGSHTCAVTSGGGIKCWGANDLGQVGDGTFFARPSPVDVSGLSSGMASLATGLLHNCAVSTGGAAKCWGRNIAGGLGDGSFTDQNTPVDVSGLTSGVASLTAGGFHTCAVMAAGGAKCWGRNDLGQVGDGTLTDRGTPVDVSGLSSGVAIMGANALRTCAATTRGGVQCWGDGTKKPMEIPALTSGMASISLGRSHTCGLTAGGGARCWGNNTDGELGDGTKTNKTAPVEVTGLPNGATGISAGQFHTCATTGAGGVKCWGFNGNGQLGDGTLVARSNPVDVSGLTSGMATVAAGGFQSCAMTLAGGLKCWGNNLYGQLGDGTNAQRLTPVDVFGLTSGVLGTSTGYLHTCALTVAGGVQCWGRNIYGALGDGTTVDRTIPGYVTGFVGGGAGVAAGLYHTCATTTGGGAKCWGNNFDGEVGDGTTTDRFTPVDVSGLSTGVAGTATGSYHSCASTTSGAIKCWGSNLYGELGNGTTTDNQTPVNVTGLLSGAASSSGGRDHTCALTTAGGVKCWGRNEYGQLGDGTTTDRLSPVTIIRSRQSIVFTPPATLIAGISTILVATASSGLPVTFDTWTPGTCTVTGNSVVAFATALCGIRASQSGDTNTAPAPQQLRLMAIPPPIATTGIASPVTDSTATFNGTINPNGIATTGFYEYGATTGYGSTTSSLSLGGQAPIGLPVALEDLPCNSPVHFRIVASHANGLVLGADSTFTTSACPLPPAVTTDAATGFTQTGATLNGTINPNVGVTRRRFQYGLTAAYGSTSPNLNIGNGNTDVPVSVEVAGLACNTLYHYRAVGQNSGGTTNGGDLTFTTAACPPVGSNNISPLTARSIGVNSTSGDSMGDVRVETWSRVRLFASRSYQLAAWPADHEQGADAPVLGLSLFSDDAGTVPASPAPTLSSAELEGSTNSNGDLLPASLVFQPTTTGVYKLRILRASGGSLWHTIGIAVRETTLFSPWTSKAAGFEGFVEMHNNTNAPISVTLRAYDSTGALQGAGLTLTLPPNATGFRTAGQIGIPVNVFAGIVLTHNGAFGAIAANITTLNGSTGLSFDSPFTTRGSTLTGPPVR